MESVQQRKHEPFFPSIRVYTERLLLCSFYIQTDEGEKEATSSPGEDRLSFARQSSLSLCSGEAVARLLGEERSQYELSAFLCST